jgi:hypothetical protein
MMNMTLKNFYHQETRYHQDLDDEMMIKNERLDDERDPEKLLSSRNLHHQECN